MSRTKAALGGIVVLLVATLSAVVFVVDEPAGTAPSEGTTPASEEPAADASQDALSARDRSPQPGRTRARLTPAKPDSGAPPTDESGKPILNWKPVVGPAPPPTPDSPHSPKGHNPFGERNPEKLRKISEEMHVGETVIAAAITAEGLVKQTYTQRADPAVGEQAKAALADLAGYGVEGYRAVLAMLRTGYQGTWFVELVKTTHQPGYEDELIAVAKDEDVAEFSRWGALQSLQVADTPAVREFLNAYLAAHQGDSGLFMSAALALGNLRDATSAPLVRDKLLREGWKGVRGYLLTALGGMGGDDARSILVEFIRDDRADRVAGAFRALARFDVEAARDEADRFFETPRGKKTSSYDRQLIETATR